MFNWIRKNKNWLFSGIGVFFVSILFTYFGVNGKIEQKDTENQDKTIATVSTIKEKKQKANGAKDKIEGMSTTEKKLNDAYIKLFEGYVHYFTNSLKPSAPEELISDELVERISYNIFYSNNIGEVDFGVTPWNYASLFREHLNFYYFSAALPPQNTRDNPIDNIYYNIKLSIQENLREYFSNTRLLTSFYNRKKVFIISGIEQSVTLRNKNAINKLFVEIIKGFELVLDNEFRSKFSKYLEIEKEYSNLIYEYISIEDQSIYLQNFYDAAEYYPECIEKKKKKIDDNKSVNLKNEIITLRKQLFEISPNLKSSAFAYRRYLEGGEELVKTYILLISDIKESLFKN